MQRVRKDGTRIDVSLWTAPLRDRDGQIVAILRLLADVTEQTHLEEQFRQAQKMEAVGRLAGGVAHDFNNILTVIGGFCDMAVQSVNSEDPIIKDLVEIKKASDRAASLTRQLLAFSRRQILAPKVLDLNSLIRDMEKMLGRILGEDVELRLSLAEQLGSIEADPGQIEQILLNLTVNARDAMPGGGQLLIETKDTTLDAAYVDLHLDSKEGDYVLLAVSDTGHGMDAHTKSHLFEPFFTTKTEGKGTGLGLATVYGIVKQSRGNIAVYSEPDHGTVFKIYLPRLGESALAKKHETLAPAAAGSETVLLAEDEETLRRLAERILAKNGYRVLSVRDGAEAIKLIETSEEPIHLLITDVVMPKAGGRQVAERATLRFPTIKVLYISGYTDDAVVLNGVLDAEVAFLQKPFSPDALAKSPRAARRGAQPAMSGSGEFRARVPRFRDGPSAGYSRLFQLGQNLGVAVGADAVAELHPRVGREIAFDLLPIVAVVADLLAVAADRQQPLQLVDLVQGLLQLADPLGQVVLERDHPVRHAEPRLQFAAVERLDEIVVGSAVEPGHEIFRPVLGGQQDEIRGFLPVQPADAAADFDAVDVRHHPVEDGDLRGVVPLENVPRRRAVDRDHDLVAPRRQQPRQHRAGDQIVLGNQNLHDNWCLFQPVHPDANAGASAGESWRTRFDNSALSRPISSRKWSTAKAAWSRSALAASSSTRRAASAARMPPRQPVAPLSEWAA